MPSSLKPHLTVVDAPQKAPAVSFENVSVWMGENCILSGVNMALPEHGVSCLVGPSGAGKSTLLRALNRINDDVDGYSLRGSVKIGSRDIADFSDITELRRKVGMVFQRPCVFPRSIAQNVLFGVRGVKLSGAEKSEIVETSLRRAALWEEVKGRLNQSAMSLSLGQQQRLCIARALAIKPEILLLDEPTASIDPTSGRAIEDLVLELRRDTTVIMVTHNIAQTKRIADHVLFLCDGQIMEAGAAQYMFSSQSDEQTRNYLGEEFCDC
ncbi:MAG: phosphate ABC transporter ATP-binding protein [Litorimonas sp.]